MGRKLFCEISPTCYRISLCKEYLLRDMKDLFSAVRLAHNRQDAPLPALVKGHRSPMLRRLDGVDPQLQQNKVRNLALAGARINGLVLRPGETFSFWHVVGKPRVQDGYLEGLTISHGQMGMAAGGGLCQLSNLIHWLVLHSPLLVTELHHHSDALFPDAERRVPFGTGTSVFYKNIDYRFKNTSNQTVQLLIWQDGNDLCGELRAERRFPFRYKIVEEDHYFAREGDRFYRNSKIYRLVYDAQRNVVAKELLLRNHSLVMYDPALIPADQLRTPEPTAK